MEINYCDQCGKKIAASEFSSGIPVRHGDQTLCDKCAAKAGIEIPPEPTAPPVPPARKKTPLQNRTLERPAHARGTQGAHPPAPTRKEIQRSTQKLVLVLVFACIAGLAITIYLLNLQTEKSVTQAKMTRVAGSNVPRQVRKELRENAQEGMQEVKALNAWAQAESLYEARQWQQALDHFLAFQKDYANTTFLAKQTVQLTLRLAAARAALNPRFELPREWRGVAEKSSDGNPFLVDGSPRWRLYQVWPDDQADSANYTLLKWNGKRWQALENAHGGQPESYYVNNAFNISARTEWPGEPGNKLAALAFVAPLQADYALNLTLRPDIWDGGAGLMLQILKRDIKTGDVETFASLQLKNKEARALKDLRISLAEGQELVLLPTFSGPGQCACTFIFDALQITASP